MVNAKGLSVAEIRKNMNEGENLVMVWYNESNESVVRIEEVIVNDVSDTGFTAIIPLENKRYILSFDEAVLVQDFYTAKEIRQKIINEIIIEENVCDAVTIYDGNIVSGLKQIPNNSFEWNTIDQKNHIRQIRLNDIFEQATSKGLLRSSKTMTVFLTRPRRGFMFECGNSEEGQWTVFGRTNGYT